MFPGFSAFPDFSACGGLVCQTEFFQVLCQCKTTIHERDENGSGNQPWVHHGEIFKTGKQMDEHNLKSVGQRFNNGGKGLDQDLKNVEGRNQVVQGFHWKYFLSNLLQNVPVVN